MQAGSYRYLYSPFYDRAMQQHHTGFKPALGGTGIGKTWSIPEVVYAPHHVERRGVYLTNKKHLLEAMKNEIDAFAPGSCVLIYPDDEALFQVMHHHLKDFDALVSEPAFQWCLDQAAQVPGLKAIEKEEFLETYQALKKLVSLKEIDQLDTIREMQARKIFHACKAVLLFAKSEWSAYHQNLLHRSIIHTLFPGIRFRHDSQVKMLLLTIHKAYMGFFDGDTACYLTQLHRSDEEHYAVFLDECDFFEPDLVSLICNTADIDDPFHVLEPFYTEMKYHRMPHEQYPESVPDGTHIIAYRRTIARILKIIDEKLIGKGIYYPRINHFTCASFDRLLQTANPKKKARARNKRVPTNPVLPIFQTRHTICSYPLHFYQTARSFELTADKDFLPGATHSAFYLFHMVNAAYRSMIDFFKRVFQENPLAYQEILQQCFGYSSFKDAIEHLIPFPSRGETSLTQRGTLLDGGYDFYDIKDLQQVTDKTEVRVRHYSMYTSPEKIVVTLAKQHLVFGLSATLDIPRVVRNFDLAWLQSQEVLLELDEEDRAIIQRCGAQKAQTRNTSIRLETISDLQEGTDSYHRALTALIEAAATDPGFGRKKGEEHLKQRVRLFFSLLLWMCEHAKHQDSLLLFLTTYHQIKCIFDAYPDNDPRLFTITKRTGHSWFHQYTLQIQGKTFLVVFYDAKVAKNIRQQEAAQQAFDELFWQGLSVIVVTQYLSAGIGINLQYRPSPEQKPQDFTHLALLEVPYYYFDVPESKEPLATQRAARKAYIWYQAKLYTNKWISERRFRERLETLEDPEWWNVEYRHGMEKTDALFNDMSIFIQALGRGDRIWTPMRVQTILLSSEVEKRFREFCKPMYSWVHQPREAFISENLRQIFTLIRQRYAHDQYALLEAEDVAPMDQNQACRLAIRPLLDRLEASRQGHADPDALRSWIQLRQAVLRHDFQDPLLQEYHCVTSSPYYHRGVIYVSKPNYSAFPMNCEQPDIICWDLNAAYAVVRDQKVIRDYFITHGYELAFDHSTQEFFTPYCYQAILIGAIGEEAITALLENEGIALEDVPDALFEVADRKVSGLPFYIDSKYYSDETMGRFSALPGETDWHEQMNDPHLREQLRRKLLRIATHHQQQVGKLIILNLVSRYERRCDYYLADCQTRVRTFEEASLVVVSGALQRLTTHATEPDEESFVVQDPFKQISFDLLRAQQRGRPPDTPPDERKANP